MSQKLSPRTAADALVGLRFECVEKPDQGPQRSRVRRGRGRPPHNEICHEPLGQETRVEKSLDAGNTSRRYCEIATENGGLQIACAAVGPPQTATLTALPVKSVGRIRSICCSPANPGAGPA